MNTLKELYNRHIFLEAHTSINTKDYLVTFYSARYLRWLVRNRMSKHLYFPFKLKETSSEMKVVEFKVEIE